MQWDMSFLRQTLSVAAFCSDLFSVELCTRVYEPRTVVDETARLVCSALTSIHTNMCLYI
jgi:hypothetical protein